MRISIATPAPPGSRKGNRATAVRWAGLLRSLGHRVRMVEAWDVAADDPPADLLVALHARRSSASVERWRARRGTAPLVVALGGTDLYEDLPGSAEALRSLALADALVVLHPRGVAALPADVRGKAVAVIQSATPPRGAPPPPRGDAFEVVSLAHLRPVKDPFLLPRALRLLPPRSRVRAVHLGAALDAEAEARARTEASECPRWTWVGDRPREEAKRRLTSSRLFVLTSRLEGAANAISEAIACGTPVLSTAIDGSVGVLGEDHPGLFPVGDAAALAALLLRAEEEPPFLEALRARSIALQPLVEPAREREAWRRLLARLPR